MKQSNDFENKIPLFDLREHIGKGRKLVIVNKRFYDALLYEPLFVEARKFLEESGYKVLVEKVDSEADSVSHLPDVLRIENVLPSIINLYDARKKNPISLQSDVCYVVSALRKSNVIGFPKVANEYENTRGDVVSKVIDFPKDVDDDNFFAREINRAKVPDNPNSASINEGKLEYRVLQEPIAEGDEIERKPVIREIGPVYEINSRSRDVSSNNKELPIGYISRPIVGLYTRNPWSRYFGTASFGLGHGLENTFYNHQRARFLTNRWTNANSSSTPNYYRKAA